ncbi:MAG: FtsX-like permease family protein [Gemmatimonadetes bacterium]|nr:FtsX-like permease family protein [Gemmatimonadota bacterium]
MRSPRWRKVVGDLWLHKARTSLVVSAICVGIVGAGSVLNAWSLLRRATHDEFDASNPASAVLRVDSVDEALLTKVRALPTIAAAQGRRSVLGSVLTSTGWKTAALTSMNDFAASAIGIIKPGQGAWPPSNAGIVIEHSSVDYATVSVGDSVTLRYGDRAGRAVPVRGVARDVGLAPGWMEHTVYMFATPAMLSSLGAPSTMNELQLLVRDRTLDRADVQVIARDVQKLVESEGHHVSEVSVPVPGRHIHAAQIESLLLTQGAFALLALLLSGVLVVNLISGMLTGQVREIGVMKAIGARAGQLVTMYLSLALMLGLIACAVSLPLAALLGRLYAEFTAGILNFDVSAFRIPWWAFVLQFAVGALLPVLAAAIPVARGCRISVSEALRDNGTAIRGESDGYLMNIRGVSRPVLLSLRNAFRRRERVVLTLATLSIGGAVYLGALNLRSAVIASVDLAFSSQQFDVVFRMTRAYPVDSMVAAAITTSGVSAAEAWTGAHAAISTPDGALNSRFAITAPPLNTAMLKLTIASGRALLASEENELVVNRRLLADEPRLAVGRRVTLLMDGRVATWHIVGTTDTGLQPAAYTSRETIEHLTGGVGATSLIVAVNATAPAAKLALVRQLRSDLVDKGFDVSSSQSMAEARSVLEDHLLMVAGFLGNMSLLMIVVGGLGLASTMSLAVLERTREIGVLRAIGAKHGAILAMIQTEGLVIAVLSWLLAIPLSLPMSIALGHAFGRVMMEVPVRLLPNGPGVVQWLGVVVAVSLLACTWPAQRATRITTAAALSCE